MIFEYDAAGYVKDEEKATLDADKILATLREGQARGNEERRRLGWDELDIGGWIRAPYYDPETHNLTWAVSVLANEDTAVNHSVRLLGRGAAPRHVLARAVEAAAHETSGDGARYCPRCTRTYRESIEMCSNCSELALVAVPRGQASMNVE